MLNSFYTHAIVTAYATTAGIIYGLVFIYQTRRALAAHTIKSSVMYAGNTLVFTALRLAFFALITYHMLPSMRIHPILLVIIFLASFWLTLLTKGLVISWKDLF